MNLVSIIIPVYNTEKYIDRCLESVLAQTHSKLEILLVDDGSSDSSGAICDSYAKKDERVRVFHLQNGGVSSARNYGIEKASGEYIIFVDSDDWLEADAVERMVERISADGVDLSVFSLTFEYVGFSDKLKIYSAVYTPYEYFTDSEQNIAYICSPCNKIYRAQIMLDNNIRFTPGIKYGEDFTFNVNYLGYTNKLSLHDESYYHYDCTRDGSGVKRLYEDYDKYILEMNSAFSILLDSLEIPDSDRIRIDFMKDRWEYAVSVCINSQNKTEYKAQVISRWLSNIPKSDISAYCAVSSLLAKLLHGMENTDNISKKTVLKNLNAYIREQRIKRLVVKVGKLAKRLLRR